MEKGLENKLPYNVAFRYTEKAGNYQGFITWTSFEDKEDFEKWYTPKVAEKQEVVAEGISEEEAIRLTETALYRWLFEEQA